ncbi:MAG TPA: portal protein [Thermoguttaceae bacterium]
MALPKNAEEEADNIIREFEQAKSNRANWDSHWREIAERIWPSQWTAFAAQGMLSTTGEKRNREVYDSTAAIALTRFGAILDSTITPRNEIWSRPVASLLELNKSRRVKLYFDEINTALFKYRYAPKSNFVSQNQQGYKSLGAFGSGPMFVDRLSGEPGIRYRNIHLSEIYFFENHQGIVDKCIRYFALTLRQIEQRWPQQLPDNLKSRLITHPEDNVFLLHCVKPRKEYDPARRDNKGMPIASYYVLIEGKKIMEEGGYQSFPYAISRYEQAPNEVYGRSPAMDVLPAIKTLNEEKKTLLKQGHRQTDPILLTHDDGVLDTASLRPGSVIAGGMSAEGRALVGTLPIGNIAVCKELMDDERAIINDAFLVTLFRILVDSPQKTATQVIEEAREKGILLAPVLGRQQAEYLGPMFERELNVLSEQRLIPPMPPELIEARGEYKIVFDSPLSRIQRSGEAAGLIRSMDATLRIVEVTQDPTPLDHYDWDTIIPEMSDINGVPARWMRSVEAIGAIRDSREQAKQAAELSQALPGIAAAMKGGAALAKA